MCVCVCVCDSVCVCVTVCVCVLARARARARACVCVCETVHDMCVCVCVCDGMCPRALERQTDRNTERVSQSIQAINKYFIMFNQLSNVSLLFSSPNFDTRCSVASVVLPSPIHKS